ncbi:hypothetical protein SAMN05192569_105312 [Parageobacillus thermantarcticus]|uniref:Uncharacterized protein n=1 Tax=Parageobacillus thermantarcticus TaxID=186116 RepID=A0A1I0TUH4_9BACL|nr:hypothetical protein [Parageobacillus thermantarcticus]SFA54606.1 hypothetical protein SAMN05192569_105312 [Parageobacillus thermantarcticus]
MNIFEARKRLNEIDQLLLSEGAKLKAEADTNRILKSTYADRILKAFKKNIIFQILQSPDLNSHHLEALFKNWKDDIEEMKRVKQYNPINALVALKIFGRRIKELERRNNALYGQLREIQNQYTNLGKELEKSPYFKGKQEILDEIYHRKSMMKEICQRDELDLSFFYQNVMQLFLLGWKISKEDFLSLISVDHNRVSWDGVTLPTYPELKESLPEQLDFEAFLEAIFIEKVEDDGDSVFFDMVVDYTAEQIDRNKEFREKAHQFIQETFGPIPTYTAAVDEFGDIVELVPNKPNLKVIH